MRCTNPNLDLVSINVYTKFCKIIFQFDLKRLSDRKNDGQPKSSIAPLFQSRAQIKGHNSGTNVQNLMCNNNDLDLVNMITYIKFGEILSIHSQDIWRESRTTTLVQMCKNRCETILS